MTLRIKLTTPLSKVKKDIATLTTQYLNSKIKKNYRSVTDRIKRRITLWVEAQPEIQSLLASGEAYSLNALFGLPVGNEQNVVRDIVNAIKDSISINIDKFNNRYSGSVEFSFLSSNFSEILNLDSGHVLTEKGTDLHWLDWLLTKGDLAIINNYTYIPSKSGRSGGGVMVKGTIFRVPPKFSGTEDNNFLIRAFSNRDAELELILRDLLR